MTLTANDVVVWKKNNNLGKCDCALEEEIRVGAWIEEEGFTRSVNKLLQMRQNLRHYWKEKPRF